MLASKKSSSAFALDKFLTLMFLHGLTTNEKILDIQKELQDIVPKNSKDLTNDKTLISLDVIERLFEKNYGYLFAEKERKLFQDFFSIEKSQHHDWCLKIKDLAINCKLCTIFSDDTYLEILNMLEPKMPKKILIEESSASTRYRKIKLLHMYGLISEHVILESENSIIKKTLFVTTFSDINISVNSKTQSNLHFDPDITKSEIIERFF